MLQMKEQDKTPEELSEMEIRNLPIKEFKVTITNCSKNSVEQSEQNERLEIFDRVRKYKEEPNRDKEYNN